MLYNITLGVGVLILIIALFVFKQSLNFLKTAQRAEATVIEVKKRSGGKGPSYTPVYGFKANDNNEYTYTPSYSSNPPSWKVGDKATIAYDGNNPAKARVVNYFGIFGTTVILMAVAMPFIVIGGGYHLAQQFLK